MVSKIRFNFTFIILTYAKKKDIIMDMLTSFNNIRNYLLVSLSTENYQESKPILLEMIKTDKVNFVHKNGARIKFHERNNCKFVNLIVIIATVSNFII